MSTELDEQIERIQAKLTTLRQVGRKWAILPSGFEPCDYALGAPLSEAEVVYFEAEHGIRLPEDYRQFLLRVGNGGAFPYDGFGRLSAKAHRIGREPAPNHLREPFPLTEAVILWKICSGGRSFPQWAQERLNPTFDRQVQACINHYGEPQYLQGAIEICHYGCGMYFFLVVTGPEAGHVWMDDLASEAGFFPLQVNRADPGRVGFLTWYEIALDRYLREVAEERWLGDGPHYWSDYEWIAEWIKSSNKKPATDRGRVIGQ